VNDNIPAVAPMFSYNHPSALINAADFACVSFGDALTKSQLANVQYAFVHAFVFAS
jgi:hypothetical protein